MMRPVVKLIAPFVLSLSAVSSAQEAAPSPEAAPPGREPTQNPMPVPATPAAVTAPSAAPASTSTSEAPPAPAPQSASPNPAPAATIDGTTPGSEPPSDCKCAAKRRGFYLRFGGGPSVVAVKGTGPRGSASIVGGGENSTLAIGGSIARGWVLAGTVQGSAITNTLDGGPFVDATLRSDDGETTEASAKVAATFSHVGMLVDWYPDPTKGWHVGASGGLGVAGLIHQADDSTMGGASVAGSAFGGYDWSLGPEWSMGLALVASGNSSTKMMDSDGDDTGYRLKSYSIGVTGSFLYF